MRRCVALIARLQATGDEAFPLVVTLHDNCGCTGCEAGHLRAVRARARLLRAYIAAGRQHLLV